MLVSNAPARLLPTIRSRCQRLEFSVPAADVSRPWLEQQLPEVENLALLLRIAGGEPLRVLNNYDETFLQRRQTLVDALTALVSGQATALQAAARLAKIEVGEVLEVFLSLVADCLKWHSAKDINIIINNDIYREIKAICNSADSAFLFALWQRLSTDAAQLVSTSNPNPQLLLEGLLIDIGRHRLPPAA